MPPVKVARAIRVGRTHETTRTIHQKSANLLKRRPSKAPSVVKPPLGYFKIGQTKPASNQITSCRKELQQKSSPQASSTSHSSSLQRTLQIAEDLLSAHQRVVRELRRLRSELQARALVDKRGVPLPNEEDNLVPLVISPGTIRTLSSSNQETSPLVNSRTSHHTQHQARVQTILQRISQDSTRTAHRQLTPPQHSRVEVTSSVQKDPRVPFDWLKRKSRLPVSLGAHIWLPGTQTISRVASFRAGRQSRHSDNI